MIYEDGDAITETLMTSTSTRRFVCTVNLYPRACLLGNIGHGGWQFTIGETRKEI
jgi:hypothetical protein